jgi:hypothetical protein
MMTSRSLICLLENQNEGKLQKLLFWPPQLSRVQMKSWAGEALETVNCYVFLKRRLIGACWQLT